MTFSTKWPSLKVFQLKSVQGWRVLDEDVLVCMQ